MGSVVLISELPIEQLDAGKRLRAKSLAAHYSECGYKVLCRPMLTTRAASKVSRLAAGAHMRLMEEELSKVGPEIIVFAGLGASHLLPLANHLAHRYVVSFDSCDSWVLQRAARQEGHVSSVSSLAGVLLVKVMRSISEYTYISKRDQLADARLLPSAVASRVIQNAVEPSLSELPDVHYPLSRIVLPVDLSSFHNGQFLESVAATVSSMVNDRVIPEVEITGKLPPGTRLPGGFVDRGWIPELREIYSGDTLVLISNSKGSGVPNKLIEAISARRPVIIHSELGYLQEEIRDDARVYWWSTPSDFARCLVDAIEGRLVDSNRAARVRPNLDM